MSGSYNQPICPTCQRPMTLVLQPGSGTPRTFKCFDCDEVDPMKSPALANLSTALQPPKSK